MGSSPPCDKLLAMLKTMTSYGFVTCGRCKLCGLCSGPAYVAGAVEMELATCITAATCAYSTVYLL